MSRPLNRFCFKGHDTLICGRDGKNWCKACAKEYRIEHKEELKNKRKLVYAYTGKVKIQDIKYKINHQSEIKESQHLWYINKGKSMNTKPHRRYIRARCTARRRKLPFFLTEEEYLKLISNPCYYCGESLEKEMGGGLDRIDNAKNIGYTISNVLPCCTRCNQSRQDHFTVEEFKVMIQALLKFRENICEQ
jgi:hypothetical protein